MCTWSVVGILLIVLLIVVIAKLLRRTVPYSTTRDHCGAL